MTWIKIMICAYAFAAVQAAAEANGRGRKEEEHEEKLRRRSELMASVGRQASEHFRDLDALRQTHMAEQTMHGDARNGQNRLASGAHNDRARARAEGRGKLDADELRNLADDMRHDERRLQEPRGNDAYSGPSIPHNLHEAIGHHASAHDARAHLHLVRQHFEAAGAKGAHGEASAVKMKEGAGDLASLGSKNLNAGNKRPRHAVNPAAVRAMRGAHDMLGEHLQVLEQSRRQSKKESGQTMKNMGQNSMRSMRPARATRSGDPDEN